jgi:hypothetical protein
VGHNAVPRRATRRLVVSYTHPTPLNSALLRQSTPRCSDCWPKDECSRAQLPLDLKVVDTDDKGQKTFSGKASRMIFMNALAR